MLVPKAAQRSEDPLWHPSWVESHAEQTIKRRQMAKKEGSNGSSQLQLYCSWFCPFAQRAWIALEEKQVEYQYCEINPYEVDPSLPGGYTKKQLPLSVKRELYPGFVECSPKGLVPAVHHLGNGDKVWESLYVVQYVDEMYDYPPYLLPRSSPGLRAFVRIWADHCTDKIQKSYYIMLMSQDPEQQEKTKQTFFEECRVLARVMGEDGPYFLGKELSLVDVALFPFWQRFLWVGKHYRDLEMPQDDPLFRRLQIWWDAVLARPAFKATLACRERLISSYSQYARNEGTSDYAQQIKSSL